MNSAATVAVDESLPLDGVKVVSIAINLPGPAAAARLRDLGAQVLTVLPPAGDPMMGFDAGWFADLHAGMQLRTLNLKDPADRSSLDEFLAEADVFITSSRPAALRRLGVDYESLHARFPRLCQIDIVGHPGDEADTPGHDLTYQAKGGLIRPPAMPATFIADLSGAERAAGEAAIALLMRARTGFGSRREVALSDTALAFAQPALRGITDPQAFLGGGHPPYSIYQAQQGWIALAALEPHFLRTTLAALQVDGSREAFAEVFRTRTALEWEAWASEHDVPLVAVRLPSRSGE
ncbi:CoA transferase [Gephyromycinifex aptenodytis]|uniref:CoA transferase n=1 Tax=Gephyromycinifex aptenodytis TaxID=2716227 RepID=UPI001B2FF629|nr:CaiB/BaiF CoA-transferase family protein [Gephyromycinifex aptenodytis]